MGNPLLAHLWGASSFHWGAGLFILSSVRLVIRGNNFFRFTGRGGGIWTYATIFVLDFFRFLGKMVGVVKAEKGKGSHAKTRRNRSM